MPDETTKLSIKMAEPADTATGASIATIMTNRADSPGTRLALCAPGVLMARIGTAA